MEAKLNHISKNQVRFIRSLQQKKVRDEEKLFVAEGDKCISELIHHFELVTLVVTGDRQQATGENRPKAATPLPLYSRPKAATPLLPYFPTPLLASPSELSQMSSLKTPQGSLAVFKQKSFSEAVLQPQAVLQRSGPSAQRSFSHSGLILALDNIQDPGNLGTIIRTADWFGITDIYCSQDTADCYNPKVVQATMGALARVNTHYVDLVEWLQAKGRYSPTPIYGTLLDGRNIYEPDAIADATRGIIIMGNEGNGISAPVREFITHPLYIPSYTPDTKHQTPSTHIESLNVAIATAITLAEFRRSGIEK